MRALRRRLNQRANVIVLLTLESGDLAIDLISRFKQLAAEPSERASRNFEAAPMLELTPVEFRLLKTLAANPGRVFSRDHLLDNLYLDHRVVTDRTIDSHIKNLRRKLEQAAPGQDPIRSIYGVGYKLEIE